MGVVDGPGYWYMTATDAQIAALPTIATANASASQWLEPAPLSSLMPSAPTMPIELVPERLRAWTEDICDRMRVPPEMIAVPLIISAASIIGTRLRIRPKRYDGWTVTPNLWGCVVAPSGAMKSPAINEALKPFRRIEAKLREQYNTARTLREDQRSMLELSVKALESRVSAALKKMDDPADFARELAAKKLEMRELDLSEPRLSTSDPTVEKLGELMIANPRGLLLHRDEIAGWLRTFERSGHENDRAFYLESWNGAGEYTVDRITRGTLHIPALTLSILGGTQPGVLRAYVREAITETAGADGLLQRIQLLVWPDELPAWQNVDRVSNAAVRNEVFEAFEALDGMDSDSVGDAADDGSRFLRFDDAAQDVFDAWREILENRLRSPELTEEAALASALAKYRSLMPSLALIFHLVDRRREPVTESAARLAADWCEFLELHARKVYAYGGAASAPVLLAERIERRQVTSGMTVREVYRKGWFSLKTPERLEAAAAVLESAGWLRLNQRESAAGRPPSPTIAINPALEEE